MAVEKGGGAWGGYGGGGGRGAMAVEKGQRGRWDREAVAAAVEKGRPPEDGVGLIRGPMRPLVRADTGIRGQDGGCSAWALHSQYGTRYDCRMPQMPHSGTANDAGRQVNLQDTAPVHSSQLSTRAEHEGHVQWWPAGVPVESAI